MINFGNLRCRLSSEANILAEMEKGIYLPEIQQIILKRKKTNSNKQKSV